MCSIFYIDATCFGVIISPSSVSWHKLFNTAYSKEIGHNKCTYIVVSIVQNFTGFSSIDMGKYNGDETVITVRFVY